jgi:hypothetical protein
MAAFLEGFADRKWELLQEEYYKKILSMRTARHWMSQLNLKLWGEVAWDTWNHRNEALNNIQEVSVNTTNINTLITSLYQSNRYPLSPQDEYLFKTR